MTPHEYAKHRNAKKLPGASYQAVHKALRDGRIEAVDGEIDPEAADAAWKRNTDVHQQGRRTRSRQGGLADDQRRLIREQAQKIALQNAITRREVAPVTLLTEVAARGAKRVAAVLEGIPGRIKRRIPGIDDDVLAVVREELVKARNLAAEVDIDLDDLLDTGDGDDDA